jgi:hypothetical protein
MKKAYRQALIKRINRKDWWHVPPVDPKAYRKRGKFYSSTFREAEFWGRPNDIPEKVSVQNPVIGDEDAVCKLLFGRIFRLDPSLTPRQVLRWRWRLDARMKRVALRKGYDSIVILRQKEFQKLRQEGKLPHSMELNLLKLRAATHAAS